MYTKILSTPSLSHHVSSGKLDPILADTDWLRSALGCTALIGESHHRMQVRIERPTINFIPYIR